VGYENLQLVAALKLFLLAVFKQSFLLKNSSGNDINNYKALTEVLEK